MSRRLTTAYAQQRAEGEALTLLAYLPLYRDSVVSVSRVRKSEPTTVYPAVWSDKGYLARVYEQRQLRARAATDPALVRQLAALADARRRRAELLATPVTRDPATLKKRADDLKALDGTIGELTDTLPKRLPAVARADKLNAATAGDLQKVLPADAAVVDFLRYTLFEYDPEKPGPAGETRTERYLAFVVTRDKIAWADLDTAASIDTAANAWRESITGDETRKIPLAAAEKVDRLGADVRKLVWEKVRKELPDDIKTLYICPDATLCKLPWAALPGDKPGTILLEQFAIATIPHAPFLLDQLWPRDERKNPPVTALVIGGVKYDAEPPLPAPDSGPKRGDPLVKPGDKSGWGNLPGTADEAKSFVAAAQQKKFTVTHLEGDKATTSAVLNELPKAKVAHFATHGFFADPSFRSAFQLDPKDYEMSRRGERIGKAANSPLVMTGLVLAGANSPKTPGRGIVTGEALIDLDLSGLELAVLSACETGVGDVAGGQGVFGLQRAFHYAGAHNVVVSLWKVGDLTTAALMGEFYANLWEKNLPPLEALRQAQLALYRADAKRFRAMTRRGIEESDIDLSKIPLKANADGGNHPVLWAAFSLSGLGR
jgi:CHAT domain-containing protein